MNELYLHVPSYDELWYRQKIMLQPDTMSYNKGYNLGIDIYDNNTGCIDFKKEYWKKWYSKWISNEPDRYYAYMVLKKTNEFIGEVCFHYDKRSDSHLIGIIIESKYRGKGYSLEGLSKLCEEAFVHLNIDKLRNEFPPERKSAAACHKKAGFKETGNQNGNCIFEMTKDDYLNL